MIQNSIIKNSFILNNMKPKRQDRECKQGLLKGWFQKF